MLNMLCGALLITAGYFLCHFTTKGHKASETYIDVKRIRPNLRNPLKTYNTAYEKFKTKEGLYEPRIPKRGDDV